MGLDCRIIMCKNRQQVKQPDFWDKCVTGWKEDEEGYIDYTIPHEVYYARKFWALYTPMARILKMDNEDIYSQPLTKENIEDMIDIATHNRDYFDSFNSVPALCEILDRYDEATENGMIFLFEGDY